MTLDSLQKTLNTKADGVSHLDQYYYNTPLDFFIFLSSISAVVGTSGQSSYSAANMYGAAVIAQRRARGLKASTVELSTVFGVGYFSSIDDDKQKSILANVQGFNSIPVSDADLHESIYEAILRASPDAAHQTGGITMGIATEMALKGQGKPRWHEDPRFGFMTARDDSLLSPAKRSQGRRSHDRKVPIKQLLTAGSIAPDEALNIATKYFTAEIENVMQLSEASVHPEASLMDVGVDSLMAIDLRAWFFRELGVNMPVLSILNGGSSKNLCKAAMEQLS